MCRRNRTENRSGILAVKNARDSLKRKRFGGFQKFCVMVRKRLSFK